MFVACAVGWHGGAGSLDVQMAGIYWHSPWTSRGGMAPFACAWMICQWKKMVLRRWPSPAKSCQVLPSPQEPCHKVLQQFLIQNIQNVGKIPQSCFASPPTPLVYHHVCSPCCDHDKATSQIVGSHDIQYVFLAGYILWDIITIIPYYIQYPLVWCCIVYIKGI